MKRFWIKVLSCFMVVNLMFMCLFTMGFAANVKTFSLNGKGDGLDVVLKELGTEDFQVLDSICQKGVFDMNGRFKDSYMAHDELVELFNKEIRSNYGNTITNTWRRLFGQMVYKPGYGRILVATAKELGIKGISEELSLNQVEEVELAIILNVVDAVRDGIIAKKGYSEWEKIERDAVGKLDELFEQGKISTGDHESIKKYGIVGAEVPRYNQLEGITIYHCVVALSSSIENNLGLKMVDLMPSFYSTWRRPWVNIYVVSLVRRPPQIFDFIWWPIASLWNSLSTNWRKTIATVFFVAMKRQQLMIEG